MFIKLLGSSLIYVFHIESSLSFSSLYLGKNDLFALLYISLYFVIHKLLHIFSSLYKSHNISEYESYSDENGDIFILSNDRPIEVGHDEHNVITCPPNTWICVSRQREYDPQAAELERRVAD